jgi:hypothetical protein
MRQFTEQDRQVAENRYGLAYAITRDGRQLTPHTHAGPNQLALVTVLPPFANQPGLVSWQLLSRDTGEILVRGSESFWRRPGSFGAAARRAIRILQARHCARVRPTNRETRR